jgi:hypothetical protein
MGIWVETKKVKISESVLKNIIKIEVEEYLKEISALGTGAVQGLPGHFGGGDDEDEPEATTQPATHEEKENARK